MLYSIYGHWFHSFQFCLCAALMPSWLFDSTNHSLCWCIVQISSFIPNCYVSVKRINHCLKGLQEAAQIAKYFYQNVSIIFHKWIIINEKCMRFCTSNTFGIHSTLFSFFFNLIRKTFTVQLWEDHLYCIRIRYFTIKNAHETWNRNEKWTMNDSAIKVNLTNMYVVRISFLLALSYGLWFIWCTQHSAFTEKSDIAISLIINRTIDWMDNGSLLDFVCWPDTKCGIIHRM